MWRKREIGKIMIENEALQKALDALGLTPPDCCGCQAEWQIAIDAIKKALAQPEHDYKDLYEKEKRKSAMWLAKYEEIAGPTPKAIPMAQPEQEPVAWVSTTELLVMRGNALGGAKDWRINLGLVKQDGDVGLYTIPPQRTWVGLTYQERCELWNISSKFSPDSVIMHDFAKDIELSLREKNYDRND